MTSTTSRPASPLVTSSPGTGFVTIPGGTPGVAHPSGPASPPGAHQDGSDFYGLGVAVAIIVGSILLVRRIVPLRRTTSSGLRPGPGIEPETAEPAGRTPGEDDPQ